MMHPYKLWMQEFPLIRQLWLKECIADTETSIFIMFVMLVGVSVLIYLNMNMYTGNDTVNAYLI